MNIRSIMPTLVGSLGLVACLGVAPASAGNFLSYVSGKGNDGGNSCAIPGSPCRTFAHALTQTNASGEIKALDPANYGALAIDKSITITGVPGAGIRMGNAGNAITINAASAVVNLRGIEIDGQGVGTAGVVAYYARVVNIVDCIVRRFVNEGIAISGGWDGMSVTISDAVSSNNGKFGVDIVPGQKPVNVSIDHTTTNDNGIAGVRAYPGARVMIADSIADNNAGSGYLAVGGLPTSSTMRLGRSVATGNQVGLQNVNGATMQSFGDNDVSGNIIDVSGAVVSIAQK
jgi:hypothetical protein